MTTTLPARGGEFELISPQSKTIRSQAAASDATVTFVSSDSWSANVEYATDDKGWVTLSQQYGDGAEAEQNLTISLKANPNQTTRDASLIISSGANPEIRISIKQAATQDSGTEEPEEPTWNQQDANAKLAVSNFAKFDAASIDEAAGTVEFCTELNCTSSGWFEWNANWTTKTYTADDGKQYRVPTALEMQLLVPGYDDTDHVYFSSPIDNSMQERLPDEILGGKGGESTSYFRTSTEKIEVGTDPALAYVVYALRFTQTEQRSAYMYRWYNSGSETDAYLAIRIKALPDDETYTLDEIVDNEEYWNAEYIEIDLPACGMNFGSVLLQGASGDYWTSTDVGLNGSDEYAPNLSFTDSYSWIGDNRKTNLLNIRMVAAE